jgi:hypothetical protein
MVKKIYACIELIIILLGTWGVPVIDAKYICISH